MIDEPPSLTGAVNETVAWPLPATADTEVGGVVIKEGQKIASLLGSANRDETHFCQCRSNGYYS